MLNFVICDDNPKIINQLSHMLESIFIQNNLEANVSFNATSDIDLLNYAKSNPIDVLILDINLHSKLNGLEVAEKIRKFNKALYLIFSTGHAEYVFLAYKYKVFDYICKPITKDRMQETILRLFDDINSNTSSKTYIRIDNKNTIIDSHEVDYIKREGMKIIFHTKNRDYEIYSSFNKLQNQLPHNFIRCHKSFIVNVNNIIKLEPSNNLIFFNDNHKCNLGPKYKYNFIKEVNSYENFN